MSNKEFYKYAKAYDIAFEGRDYEEECDFIEWCLKNHSKLKIDKIKNLKFVELGCGPAHHAREFARRNWQSTALDLSEEMIAYAEQLSKKENLSLDYLCEDMCNYKMKSKAHLSGMFTESITHILTNEDLIS